MPLTMQLTNDTGQIGDGVTADPSVNGTTDPLAELDFSDGGSVQNFKAFRRCAVRFCWAARRCLRIKRMAAASFLRTRGGAGFMRCLGRPASR